MQSQIYSPSNDLKNVPTPRHAGALRHDIALPDLLPPVVIASFLMGLFLNTVVLSMPRARYRQLEEEEVNSVACYNVTNCIFPFYLEEDLVEACMGVCPVRNITTTINEINSFVFNDLFLRQNASLIGYCPVNVEDPTSLLDPELENCAIEDRVRPFRDCRDDCPLGKNKCGN